MTSTPDKPGSILGVAFGVALGTVAVAWLLRGGMSSHDFHRSSHATGAVILGLATALWGADVRDMAQDGRLLGREARVRLFLPGLAWGLAAAGAVVAATHLFTAPSHAPVLSREALRDPVAAALLVAGYGGLANVTVALKVFLNRGLWPRRNRVVSLAVRVGVGLVVWGLAVNLPDARITPRNVLMVVTILAGSLAALAWLMVALERRLAATRVPGVIERVVWVHLHDGRVLVGPRRTTGPLPLPTVSPAPGESDIDAAARLVRDTLKGALVAESVAFLSAYDVNHDEGLLRLRCYTGELSRPVSVKDADGDPTTEWVAYGDLHLVDPDHHPILRMLHQQGRLRPVS